MRIVGGNLKGRRLTAPSGRLVRPTGDRVREALFNALSHAAWTPPDGFDEAEIVDVFAGSGALGFEALSRGARDAVFIERAAGARAAIQTNAAALGVADRVRILNRTGDQPGPAPKPCRFAFLDPPYGRGLAGPALAALRANGWLEAGAAVIVELANNEDLAPPPGFETVDRRRYGGARVVFLINLPA